MKEICIDARMLGSTGIGTYLKNLIFHFQKSPFNVKLIVHPSAPKEISWLDRFELIFCTATIYSIEEQLLRLAQKAYVKLVIPKAIKRSEQIITNSHFSKMELRK